MEKLHELYEDGGFDLIVVDTPPSRHALDFLDAPAAAAAAAQQPDLPAADGAGAHRAARSPAPRCRRSSARSRRSWAPRSSTTSSRSSARSRGWRRASGHAPRAVVELLGEPETRFVLVTSPRRDAIEEARFFAERIGDHDLSVDALIVNRVHPRFGEEIAVGLRARPTRCASSTSATRTERRRATGSRRGTRTSPSSTRSPSANGATSRRVRVRTGARGGRVRAVPRARRARLRTRWPRSARSCSARDTEPGTVTGAE